MKVYLGFLFLALAVVIAHRSGLDPKWGTLWIWGASLGIMLAVLALSDRSYAGKATAFLRSEAWPLALVLMLAITSRFALLDAYPHISIGDELRDAGLNSLNIRRGHVRDFFDVGTYSAYGNFMPLFSYPFLLLLGQSFLAFRIPTAIIAILSIVLTYVLGCIWRGRMTGMVAAVMLIGSFHHMHYGRTEMVVISDSLVGAAVLLAAGLALKLQHGFFLLGLVSGLSLHLYLAARPFVLITIAMAFFFALASRPGVRVILLQALGFLSGVLAGAGPKVNHAIDRPNILYRSDVTSSLLDAGITEQLMNPMRIALDYGKAFSLYFQAPAQGDHFRYLAPLVPFPCSIIFAFGLLALVYVLIIKRRFDTLPAIILVQLLLLPLTNQVLVASGTGIRLGATHRVMSALPLLALITGFGMSLLSAPALRRRPRETVLALSLLAALFLARQFMVYFMDRVSDTGYDGRRAYEYVFQAMLEHIKQDKGHERYFIVYNPAFAVGPSHYSEKADYLTDPKDVCIVKRQELPEVGDTALPPTLVLASRKGDLYPGFPIGVVEAMCREFIPGVYYNCPRDGSGLTRREPAQSAGEELYFPFYYQEIGTR